MPTPKVPHGISKSMSNYLNIVHFHSLLFKHI